MPQVLNSSTSTLASDKPNEKQSEKRTFSGAPQSTNKAVNSPNSQVAQKIKNFFRIKNSDKDEHKEKQSHSSDGRAPTRDGRTTSSRADFKSSLRQSRFLPHLGGNRNRSTTIASEGNPLDDTASPTINANPYFQHQGPPALRHYNENSVPPSPPDGAARGAPNSDAEAAQALNDRQELARKLRRVASAPNAQGLFAKGKDGSSATEDPQPGALTALGNTSSSALSVVETDSTGHLLPISADGIPTPGQIRNSVAYRRTYSSNSIKIRNVEVGPSSFEKVKLIGKGDVGKVYLVKEYKSQRLYAMKGSTTAVHPL